MEKASPCLCSHGGPKLQAILLQAVETKMDNLMNCQLQCQKCEQNVFFTHYVNEAVISHGVKK